MDTDEARRRLAEERERLLAVRASFADEHLDDEREDVSIGELSGHDQHQADVGTETFEREKDLSILEQVEAELADVEHALRRLEEGTYGVCEACGGPIGEERLRAVPAARLCVDDQAAVEREMSARRGVPD
jgi:RNA polymerase-binding transcription factor DksA